MSEAKELPTGKEDVTSALAEILGDDPNFGALETTKDGTKSKPKPKPKEVDEDDDDEAEDTEDSEEGEADEDDNEDDEEDESETEEDEDEDDETDKDDDEKDGDGVTVIDAKNQDKFSINGEEYTGEQVRAGFMANKVYQKKAKELAAKRKETDTHSEAYAALARAALEKAGGNVAKFEKVDWEKLDKDQYALARKQETYAKNALAELQKEAQTFLQHREEVEAQQKQERGQVALEALQAAIPDFNEKYYSDIADYAVKELGMDKDDFNNILDAPTLIALDKARKYDGAEKSVKKTKEKAKTKKAKGKTIKKTKGAPAKKVSEKAKRLAALKKRGAEGVRTSTEDAAKVLEEQLGL